jgi:16S rRNA A1518/A1519 N6-dimethyltransferase RsmA/KsgA/DIM1 with predicted DNA glycosylase/AP lyase activity
MAKVFLIDEELANKIIDMLDDKPYKEVYEIMEGLLHLKEAPVVEVPK